MSTQSLVRQAEKNRMSMERLVFFSDAVFAIAITLLAIDIHLPVDAAGLGNTELFRHLLDVWPKALGYMVSFLVIGNFWVIHHRQFRYIERYDTRLVYINLLILLAVAFIPFPTAVISENGNRTATVFYALAASLVGLFSAVLWTYAARGRRLVSPEVTPAMVRRGLWRNLCAPAILLGSIALAFVDPDLAKYSWILIAPAVFLIK
jgi:uncharacterized membrane protein